MKQKKCKICREPFTPIRDLQPTCTKFECMQEYAIRSWKKQTDKIKKEARKKIKQHRASDRTKLLNKAQTVFNKYIRLRDGKKCISCGYEGSGRQFHAGHYKSQGGNSALRYNENNCHSQCQRCNVWLSGNLAEYRKALIAKIGLEEVENLESDINIKKWTVDELKEIISTYKQKIKGLEND